MSRQCVLMAETGGPEHTFNGGRSIFARLWTAKCKISLRRLQLFGEVGHPHDGIRKKTELSIEDNSEPG